MSNSIGQTGEYLVASELCRRGIIATTFSRNMPGFDILAFNIRTQNGSRIQVKTKTTGDWQLNAKDFLRFNQKLFEKGIQKVLGVMQGNPADYFIFVKLGGKYGGDEFYILTSKQIKETVRKNYGVFRKRKSTHAIIKDKDLEIYKDKWLVLIDRQK